MKIQKHIKIDLNKSTFAYPVRAVQYDTGVQLVLTLNDFEIPDGTTAIVYFMKPSGKFVYQEDNITISDNTITIDVHNQAFTEYGKVKYQVELTNGSDIITTFSRLVEVEKSLSNSGGDKSTTVIRAFEELTADKIAEIEASTQAFIESVKQDIEAKGEAVLATIPDEYTEMSNKVDYLYDNVANALKGNVSGSVVAVDDVSPVEHNPIVWVHGKNLCSMNAFNKMGLNGVSNSYDSEKHTMIMNADSTGYSGRYCSPYQKLHIGKKYTVSFDIRGTAGKKVACGWDKKKKQIILTDEFVRYEQYFTVTSEKEPIVFYTNTAIGGLATGEYMQFANVQIELGDTATAYEEWIEPTTVTISANEKTYIPDTNGDVSGVSSVDLVNGITTNNDKIMVECEYIKDSNKVIEKLTKAIIALGGSV